eukprot:1747230-Amphidinium_carterae.1
MASPLKSPENRRTRKSAQDLVPEEAQVHTGSYKRAARVCQLLKPLRIFLFALMHANLGQKRRGESH